MDIAPENVDALLDVDEARTARANALQGVTEGARLGLDAPPWGDHSTSYPLRKKEQPEHRLIAALKATGRTAKEIAALTGYSEVGVLQILSQPGVKAIVFGEISRRGAAGLALMQEFINSQTLDALETVVSIMNDEKKPSGVRLKAASSLIDRALGTAVQRVESAHVTPRSVEQIENERAAIRAKLAQVTGVAAAEPPPIDITPA